MTREEKCLLAVKRGFTYDPDTGIVYGARKQPIATRVNKYRCLYIYLDGKRKYLYAHQFAWFVVHGTVVDCIDHKDQDKLNNRIDNLRAVTKSFNAINSKTKGFSYDKRAGKFEAYISVNKKKRHLGYFEDEEEASARAKQERKKILTDLLK